MGWSVIPSDLISYQEVVQLRAALEREISRTEVLSCYFVLYDDIDILRFLFVFFSLH